MRESMMNAKPDGARDPASRPLRLAVALDGDPGTTSAAGTKFGLFIESLRSNQSLDVVGVGDATLSGPLRPLAMAVAWRPSRRAWKEHYRKNPVTFQLRSHQIQRWASSLTETPDVVLQVGGMSRPGLNAVHQYALYLDFTFALTQREWPARAPMSRLELPIWKRLESQAYHGAAAIFSRSQHVARSLRDDYGVAGDKIHVVGAGVNIALPDEATLPGRTQPRVLFIGSDFRRKGGDTVLAAWQEVQRRVPHAELTMIGPVDATLPENVETNGGRWDPMTIIRELRRASVFVMPSRCETWGDVFLEAMAYALPCIGSSNDAMPEIIEDGRTGYIVPPDNPNALADRICDLLLDPERARAFGAAGRRRVEERYLWDDVIGQMQPILMSIRGGAV